VLLSQDKARFPMVPTLCRTLGVKGHRPEVGTWDCKDLLYVLAAVNVVTARLHTNTVAAPARKRGGPSKTRLLQKAFASHLRHVAQAYPAQRYQRVVLIIDNAPWHAGQAVADALTEHPHLELYRLPSYSPQLNVIERFWKLLRRRATHNRLFNTLAELKAALRASLCYYQTVRQRLVTLIADCYSLPAPNQTASTGL
jgi:transposase